MNKKVGMSNIGWITVAIVTIVGLILAIGIISGGLKIGWDNLKEALGVPSKHLEAFNVTVPEVEEIKTEAEKMRQFLADAAGYIKEGKYSDAVKKYILYYDGCEKEYKGYKWEAPTCRITKREGTKFRILNALRDKYFVSIKNGIKPTPEKDIKILDPNLITRLELDSIVALVSISAYTSKDSEEGYQNALIYENTYRENYQDKDENKINQLYYAIAQSYRIIKKEKAVPETLLCVETLKDLNNMEIFIHNEYFKEAFEGYKGKKMLTALDYKFLEIPHDEIERVCKP